MVVKPISSDVAVAAVAGSIGGAFEMPFDAQVGVSRNDAIEGRNSTCAQYRDMKKLSPVYGKSVFQHLFSLRSCKKVKFSVLALD